MSFSYGQAHSTRDADVVRFLIQDTSRDRQKVTDQEIAWALSQFPNVYRAAALICDSLAARSGGVQSRRLGDLAVTYATGPDGGYAALAKRLRSQAARLVTPVAGGISVADKEALGEDSDRVPPFFGRSTGTVPLTEPEAPDDGG